MLGIHDIFLRFSGGGWNFDTFKITLPSRPGLGVILAASFNEAKGIQNRGGIVCETADGSWTRYDGVDFGTGGVDTVAITYACEDAHAGGTIGVHLDRPDAPPAAEMVVETTHGWRRFSSKLLPVTNVTGSHDVYLTFSGKWHGIADISAIQFLERTTPASGPSRSAEAVLTRQPASDRDVAESAAK